MIEPISCEQETEQLRDDMDDVVDSVAKIIEGIAYDNDDFICSRCLITARLLFSIIMRHGDENAVINVRERFKEITGREIDDY